MLSISLRKKNLATRVLNKNSEFYQIIRGRTFNLWKQEWEDYTDSHYEIHPSRA